MNPATQPADCTWNGSFIPDTSVAGCTATLYDPSGRPDHPVVCIDWCDARAYCEWAGKRLCLDAGGKPTNGDVSSEWGYACTANLTLTFPYADTYEPATCNGKDLGLAKLTPVGSLSGCEGGLPGLFDMSGNALEWAGSCKGTDARAECTASGGSYKNGENFLECFPAHSTPPRSFVANDLGFRCCADPVP